MLILITLSVANIFLIVLPMNDLFSINKKYESLYNIAGAFHFFSVGYSKKYLLVTTDTIKGESDNNHCYSCFKPTTGVGLHLTF